MTAEGHGDIDFRAGDQVDGEAPFVEDCECAFQEATRGGAFVGAEVDDQDAVLHRYGCGAFCAVG